jgi:enterochelin esterase family protein
LIERLPDVPDSLLLTLLWRGDDRTRNVAVVGGVAGWVPAQNVMRQVSGSDVWYRSYVISGDARFTYFLSPNDPLDGGAPLARIADLRTDPWNPDSIAYTRTRSVSTYEGPDAPAQRWSFRRSAAAPGRVERRTFVSSVLGNERFVWLYTPPGWVSGAECGLLVLLDGHDYVTYTDTPAILDNLMDSGKVPCLAAVMVGNAEGQRGIELPPNERFSDFIVQELVPWAKQSLGVTPPPSMTVIAGSSYGGLAAAWLGFRHPEVFGNVLAQSGSFWWSPQNDAEPEWLTRQFAAAPLLPVRFHLDIGLMESRSRNPLVPTMLTVNRHMRDVLSAKGYLVHYVEFNGGHEHLNWRGTLAEGLLDLMGRPK